MIIQRGFTDGGGCGFTNDYADSYVNKREWNIDAASLPEALKEYVDEIDDVFNSNVEHGCCGGCL